MNVFFKSNLVAILLSCMIFGTSCIGSVDKGKLAPDIQTNLQDGSHFSLYDLRGDYVLLDFWGSWCPPCLKEAPAVVSLYNDYKNTIFDEKARFHIVSIALERNNNRWQKTAARLGMEWPFQLVDISRFVATSDIASSFGVKDIPVKFLIAPDGRLLNKGASIHEIRTILESHIKE